MAYASNEIELDDIFSVYLLRRKSSLETIDRLMKKVFQNIRKSEMMFGNKTPNNKDNIF